MFQQIADMFEESSGGQFDAVVQKKGRDELTGVPHSEKD